MPHPAGYLLTWCTYGAWLHGDPRGSMDAAHNTFGQPPLLPDPAMQRRRRASMKEPPFSLDAPARQAVKHAIIDHCAIRSWTLEALNVRVLHLHLVARCGAIDPEPVMQQFKSWSTRRLRAAGLIGDRTRIWVEHGSTRYLWDEESVWQAARYVLLEQGEDLGTTAGRLAGVFLRRPAVPDSL